MSLSTQLAVSNTRLPEDDHSMEDDTILSWVCARDMQLEQSEILALRTQGTGEWILSSPAFEEWSTGRSETCVLWCPGLPQTGKSVLTSIVVDHLRKTHVNSTIALAYIYCDPARLKDNIWNRKFPNDRTALLLLSSICRQLASQKAEMPSQLLKLYRQLTLEREKPGIDDIMLVILSLCDSFDKVFICVDGLDRCDADGERPILISKLQWMRNHSARIFVTSEVHHGIPEPCGCHKDIFEAFEHDGRLMIRDADEEDIRKCLLNRLANDWEAGSLLARLSITADAVIEPIVADCGAMFLMAQLQLDEKLRRLRSESEEDNPGANPLETVASTVPDRTRVWQEGIQIIQQQQPLHRDIALIALGWVVHAKEPLRVPELTQALSIECGKSCSILTNSDDIRVPGPTGQEEELIDGALADKDATKLEMVWERATPLLDICKGLIIIRREQKQVCLSEDCTPPKQLAELFPNAHLRIARICLEFLSQDKVLASDELDDVRDQEEMDRLHDGVDLKPYAKRHWATHVSFCQDDALDELAVQYLRKVYERPARWIEQMEPLFQPKYSVAIIDDETPLLKAARFGLNRVLAKLLLSRDYDTEDESWRGETAMSVAVAGGHVSTVQLLYKQGAFTVNHRDEYGDTLLHLAAQKNDEIMVSLLLNYGFEVNWKSDGHSPETPLQTAVSHGSLKATEVLLNYGADMSVQHRGLSMMQYAARGGYEDIVKLMVRRGFDLSIPTGGEPVLFSAVESGSLSLVKYMVAGGANALELNSRGTSSIHRAVREGHFEIVKYLVEQGVDPFREDDGPNEVCDGATALEEAMSKNHQDIVEFLLPRLDSQVHRQTLLGVVRAAIRVKSRETAKRLLEMVTGDLTYKSEDCEQSLLGTAIGEADDEMLSLLLDRGLSPTAQDDDGLSPLHVAARRNASASKILLERGADPNLQSKYGSTPLHVAAYAGELQVIGVLLECGPDLSIRAEDGSTALVAAIYGEQPEATKLLLQHGAPVNLFNIDGETAIHHAIIDNNGDLVQELLDHEIDISIHSRKGGSALHLAAFKGHASIVRQLLSYGADVELGHEYRGEGYAPHEVYGWDKGIPWNRAGQWPITRPCYWSRIETQWRPLHSAVCGGHGAVVEILLQHGANPSSRGLQGETPLHVAASAAEAYIVEMLLTAGGNVSEMDNNGNTPLHSAAIAAAALSADKTDKHLPEKDAAETSMDLRRSACADVLLNHGADPTWENQDGFTPLVLAARAGHDDVVETLLDRNPSSLYSTAAYVKLLRACAAGGTASALKMISDNVTETDESLLAWDAILDSACMAGDQEMVSLALQKGAVPTSKDADGNNPLHTAIEKEQVKIVDLLLGARADFLATDASGRNALHIASSNPPSHTVVLRHGDPNKERIAAYLLEDGAPVNSRTPDGDTSLHFAVVTGNEALVRTLLENGASLDVRNKKGSTPLHTAVSTWVFPDIVKLILSKGACPSAQDHAGRTPLHYIRTDEGVGVEAADLLLRNGADHFIRARNGNRAIHCATRRNIWHLIERLLEAGASVHDEGAKGRTVLHVAARKGHVSLVEALIKLGADVNAVDRLGWTPLHYAANGRHLETLSVLLKYRRPLSIKQKQRGVVPIAEAITHDDEKVARLLAQAEYCVV